MKKTIIFASAGIFIITLITGCTSPAEKVQNAQNNVNEANTNLDEANQAYLADVENYRRETAEKIAVNNKSIADFKARKESEKQDAQADYKNKIDALEQKNSDMKKKMDDYKVEGREKWELFKKEFSYSMDELGKSFRDITTKN